MMIIIVFCPYLSSLCLSLDNVHALLWESKVGIVIFTCDLLQRVYINLDLYIDLAKSFT